MVPYHTFRFPIKKCTGFVIWLPMMERMTHWVFANGSLTHVHTWVPYQACHRVTISCHWVPVSNIGFWSHVIGLVLGSLTHYVVPYERGAKLLKRASYTLSQHVPICQSSRLAPPCTPSWGTCGIRLLKCPALSAWHSVSARHSVLGTI